MLRAWILTPLLLAPLLLSEAPAPTPPSFEILTSVRPSNVGPVQLLRLATPGTLHCTAVVLRHPGASEPLATMETYIVPDWRGAPSLQISYRDVGSLRIGFVVSSQDPHRQDIRDGERGCPDHRSPCLGSLAAGALAAPALNPRVDIAWSAEGS